MIDDTLSWRRQPRPEDADAIAALLDATAFFSAEEVVVARELVDEACARGVEASGYHFLLAEAADHLAGYACFGPIACTRARWDLFWIAVAPAWQGRGLGSRLVEAVESAVRAAGGERLYIETAGRPQYVPTRAFYAARGYTLAATVPDFYDDGDDEVIFAKDLRGVREK